MAILNIQLGSTGLAGVLPRLDYIRTNDTISKVLTTGYLNKSVDAGYAFQDGDLAVVQTKTSINAVNTQAGLFQVQFVSPNWNLTSTNGTGAVTLPTIVNHIATYSNITGGLTEDASTAINGGSLQAGLSGTAGQLISFPGAASTGSLVISATANSGNTNVIITNAAHGQASTYAIADCGNAAGVLLNAATATPFTSGHLLVASGTSGLIGDAGLGTANLVLNTGTTNMASGSLINLDAGTATQTGAPTNSVTLHAQTGTITTVASTLVAGSASLFTLINNKITASSVILVSLVGGTNTALGVVIEASAGSGSATIIINNNNYNSSAFNGTIIFSFAVF
jgi:hypothetical protein